MSDRPDLEMVVTDWLRAGAPPRAPDHVLVATLDRVARVGQERPLGGMVGTRIGRSPRLRLALVFALVATALLAMLAAAGVLRESPRPPVSGTFEPTGKLAFARYGHTALLLQDGRVLVIGEERGVDGQLPAEVYDPRTGGFTTLDPIPASFGRHDPPGSFSATPLADGRVLVAGGWVEGFSSAAGARDAALFDPASGATTPTGPMTGGRAGHVATRLHDGRVLIVGGIGTSLPDGDARSLASGELYDPGSGTFAVTSEMACARSAWLNEQFAATVLPSGRVLVSGGVISEACSDEIYDPTTGNFDSILSAGPRDGVSTVVLLFPNRVYRYDLRTGTAADITPQPEGLVRKFGNHCRDLPFDCRVGTTTTRLTDGRVLLVGGSTYEDSPLGFKPQKRVALTSGEVLDPTSGALEPTGSLVEPRSGHTATLLADGRVLIIGGEGEQLEPRILLSSAEIFTPD